MKRFFSVAFFKDKKNIAILTLVVLLLGSFSAMGNQQKDEKEYKVQIQKLTKSNEEAAKDYKTLKNEFDSYKKENEQYIALGKKEEQTKKEKAAEEKKKKEAEKAKQEKEAAEKTAKEQEIARQAEEKRKQEEAAAAQAQQQQEAAAAKEAQQQERTVYVARNGTADVYWYNLDNMPRNTRFDRVVTMTEADAINAGKHHTSKE
ncbi:MULTISPECIES: hypothetical protein [Streptococcus]|nr:MULTISPECIES: hypothetical protein [Streptococcus]AIK77276.1 hypothetical protein DK43_02715 [Streptococcus anginosus]ANW85652.1 deoxyribonuclease [Streptococcus anginosus]ETS96138.1 hypothetical protein HMPREF1512_1221 [Streptococcus sp. OBRC6]EUB15620.1 hypothetical protein HMPREF1510_1778 [Streptococcus sp. ACC21]EUC75579.1 hypothetical protein HMPREF1511_1186 [Streptococcus sp. CM7]